MWRDRDSEEEERCQNRLDAAERGRDELELGTELVSNPASHVLEALSFVYASHHLLDFGLWRLDFDYSL